MTYTKLLASITDSTIWREPDTTRLVWVTMLAMADQNGVVGASIPGLADRARVSLDATVVALNTFHSPDKWSRTQEYEGRRIADVDGGWVLLNHAKHRAAMNADDRREQAKLGMRRLRERLKTVNNTAGVNEVSGACAKLTQAEADAEERKHLSDSRTAVGSPKGKQEYSPDFQRLWTAYPNKVQKDTAYKAFLKRKPDADLTEAMVVAVTKQKKGASWTKNEGKFIPHLATWLNGGGWKDELTQPRHDDGLRGAI